MQVVDLEQILGHFNVHFVDTVRVSDSAVVVHVLLNGPTPSTLADDLDTQLIDDI